MMRPAILPLAALSLLLAGCAPRKEAPLVTPQPASPAPAEKPLTAQEIMPLAKGNAWTYEVIADGAPQPDMVWSVVDTKETSEGLEATVQLATGTSVERQIWRQTAKGLFQVSGGGDRVRNEPPQPIFLVPVTFGARSTYKGKGFTVSGEAGEIETQTEVLGPQEITLPIGQVKATAIETISVYKDKDGATEALITSWYQPSVGLVQYRMEVRGSGTTLLRLRKSNLK